LSPSMRPSVLAIAMGCGLALVLSCLVACRDLVGFEEPARDASASDAGTQPSTTACALPYASSDCADCARQRCCTESMACADDPACRAQARCLAKCGAEPGCRAQCALAAPVSQSSDAAALAACMASECADDCGLACGMSLMDYGEVPPEAAEACHDCMVESACVEAEACAGSADCDALRRCVPSCRTPDCQLACNETHEAGRALSQTLLEKTNACAAECARGSNWSCVGRVNWPQPESERTTLTMDFVIAPSQRPYVGGRVAACERTDTQCERPAATGVTDENGRVVREIEDHTSGFEGSELGFNGFLHFTHPAGAMPWFGYWGYPFSKSRHAWTAPPDVPGAHPIRLANAEAVEALLAAFHITRDPNRGEMLLEVVDCVGAAAGDVEFTLEPFDPDVVIVHGANAAASVTSRAAPQALMSHVPLGAVDVIATPRALGRPSSRQTVFVRADSVVGVYMLPTP
jgi:hypothetical protein